MTLVLHGLVPVCLLENAPFQQYSYMLGWPEHKRAAGELAGLFHDADNNWSLLWADEFEGSALDASSWTPLEGDGSAYGIPGMVRVQLSALHRDVFMHVLCSASCTRQIPKPHLCL